ncbi:MAG: heavy-metal-associated domain-containing protein [Deltaproteobacteria bacterium]|nr:heavy-metal-associated domain-containing protein [Deltaproteobacteria bacterium]
MKKIIVKGMSCQHCVMAVTKALSVVDGVTAVNVDLAKGEASYEETKPVSQTTIKAAIEKAGYKLG